MDGGIKVIRWWLPDPRGASFNREPIANGLMRIELAGGDTVELGPRQAFTVPKGMLHRPVVPQRTAVLMIEKAGVVPTGT